MIKGDIMKTIKKILSFVVCCSMILGLLSACGNKTEENTQTPVAESVKEEQPQLSNEQKRAISYEIMPESWTSDLSQTITFKQYTEVLTEIVKRWNPDQLGEWQNITAMAAESEDLMDREDGLLMLSYLWILMDKASEEVYYVEEDDNEGIKYYTDHRYHRIYTDRIYEAETNSLSCKYPHFSDWNNTVYHGLHQTNYMFGAVWTFPFIISPITNESIVSLDENNSLNLREPLTIGDSISMAIRMADYCLIELDPNWREYVHVTEAGVYNKDILTDDILNSSSNLPKVTQDKFPSEWKGAGIVVRKGFSEEYMHYEESDIVFLKENGFNFGRLYLDFETLRYPDYPTDPYMINLKELEELDQLLAWAIQNDIHIQISMRGYMDENGVYLKDAPQIMPETDAAWELTQAYWTMLAERYAGISSKYITFDLCNEAQPNENEIQKHKEKLGTMVSAIRSIDPERVMLYSQWNMGNIQWAEAIVSLGIGLGCHPYLPTYITVGGNSETSPYAEPVWPQPYFPTGQLMSGNAQQHFEGEVAGSEMKIHLWYSDEYVTIRVYADGQLINEIKPQGLPGENGEFFYYDELYSTKIPENVEKVSLQVLDGFARIDNIIFEKNGISTNLIPCDTMAIPDESEPVTIFVHGDGTYSNSENIVYDAERIYQTAIEPYKKIAENNNVGFIVNEFGMFGVKIDWDIEIVTAFHEEYLELLENNGIAWSYCEIANYFPKHLVILFFEESQWANATEEDITYTLSNGETVTVRVCKELLDVFHKYTLK